MEPEESKPILSMAKNTQKHADLPVREGVTLVKS